MIDYSRYEGHTPGPWSKDCAALFTMNKIHYLQLENDTGEKSSCANAILAFDAPIILEALKASEARVKELEDKLKVWRTIA